MTRDPRQDPYPADALRMDAGDIIVVTVVQEVTRADGAPDIDVGWCNGPGAGMLSLDAWRQTMKGTEVIRVTPATNNPPAEYQS